MKKIIIFDFTKTIYDPENDRIIPGTEFVLRALLSKGFTLYLVSSAGEYKKEWIKSNVGEYFSELIIREEKEPKDFERLIIDKEVDRGMSFVIGDRRDIEISIGNSLGVQTIWINTDPATNKKSRKKLEQPTHTVLALKDILKIICCSD